MLGYFQASATRPKSQAPKVLISRLRREDPIRPFSTTTGSNSSRWANFPLPLTRAHHTFGIEDKLNANQILPLTAASDCALSYQRGDDDPSRRTISQHGDNDCRRGRSKRRRRKSWLKSPSDSNRSTRTGGNCVTVFIYLAYSMKGTKTSPQLQAGMELSVQKCKRCPRFEM